MPQHQKTTSIKEQRKVQKQISWPTWFLIQHTHKPPLNFSSFSQQYHIKSQTFLSLNSEQHHLRPSWLQGQKSLQWLATIHQRNKAWMQSHNKKWQGLYVFSKIDGRSDKQVQSGRDAHSQRKFTLVPNVKVGWQNIFKRQRRFGPNAHVKLGKVF